MSWSYRRKSAFGRQVSITVSFLSCEITPFVAQTACEVANSRCQINIYSNVSKIVAIPSLLHQVKKIILKIGISTSRNMYAIKLND